MNYKEILGDKYTDGMKAEEVLALLEGFNLHNLSDGTYVAKGKIDEKNAEIAKLRDVVNAYKQKEADGMTDAQKRDLEFAKLKEDMAALNKENQRYRLKETILDSGFSAEECAKILAAQESGENIAAVYAGIMNAKIAEAVKSAKAEMIKTSTPPPPQGKDMVSGDADSPEIALVKSIAQENLVNTSSVNAAKGAYSILSNED